MPARPFENGVYTPLITPMTEDEQVDHPALEKQVIRLANAGMGIVLLGTNGEGECCPSSQPVPIIRLGTACG
jgi:dihydrodipicolinate synthase/N-acetylneuraminate lyase